MTLYLDQDINSFLDKFTNVTNTLACIVRSFGNLEYVRVLAAVGVIVGTHIIEPFLSLTSSSVTDYSKLMEAFPQLYRDLVEVKLELLLDLSSPALKFVSPERFKSCLYPAELLEPTKQVIEVHRNSIVKVLGILLPKLADGWSLQRGAVFSFGPQANKDCSTKISDLNQEKLKNAPINNLDPERSVGTINHELKCRGAKQLAAASSALVKGKGYKLIKGEVMDKKYVKMGAKDGEVSKLIRKWKDSQAKLQEDGVEGKEASNLHADQQRHKDLSALQSLGGPFATPEDIDKFMDVQETSEEDKNKCLYLEVGYIGLKNFLEIFPLFTKEYFFLGSACQGFLIVFPQVF